MDGIQTNAWRSLDLPGPQCRISEYRWAQRAQDHFLVGIAEWFNQPSTYTSVCCWDLQTNELIHRWTVIGSLQDLRLMPRQDNLFLPLPFTCYGLRITNVSSDPVLSQSPDIWDRIVTRKPHSPNGQTGQSQR